MQSAPNLYFIYCNNTLLICAIDCSFLLLKGHLKINTFCITVKYFDLKGRAH